jgi:hypothetical protein
MPPAMPVVSIAGSDVRLDGESVVAIPARALTDNDGFVETTSDGGRVWRMSQLTAALKARSIKRARVEVDPSLPYRVLSGVTTAFSNARLDEATVVTTGDASQQLDIRFALVSKNGMVVFSSELDIGSNGYVLRFGEKKVAPGCRSATSDKTVPTVPLLNGARDLHALRACIAAMRSTTEPMLWKEGTTLVVHPNGDLSAGDVLESVAAARGADGTSYTSVLLGLP